MIASNSGVGQVLLMPKSIIPSETIHQLRIYQIPKNNRVNFHKRFQEQAIRIMRKHGFNFVAIWESEHKRKIEFVYLLEWKNSDLMKKAWNSFMTDQEWKDIKTQTSKMFGNFVDNIEDRTLILTNYSPRKTLISSK